MVIVILTLLDNPLLSVIVAVIVLGSAFPKDLVKEEPVYVLFLYVQIMFGLISPSSGSDAVAVKVTFVSFGKLAPSLGDVMLMVGGWLSGIGVGSGVMVIEIDALAVLPPESATVAVMVCGPTDRLE